MMDIGTGIAVGATILGIVAVLFRIFPKKEKNNPNSKYLLEKVFIEFKDGVNAQLENLTNSIERVEGSIKRVHSRIDQLRDK